MFITRKRISRRRVLHRIGATLARPLLEGEHLDLGPRLPAGRGHLAARRGVPARVRVRLRFDSGNRGGPVAAARSSIEPAAGALR